MMGRRRGDQASLFYEFRLDDRVPKDHLLRRIDVFVTSVLSANRDRWRGRDPTWRSLRNPIR